MKSKYKQFSVLINGHKADLDVSITSNGNYKCLFNQVNKDFINGLGARGFISSETIVGAKEIHFTIIPLYDKTELTQKMMKEIWHQIPQEQLPK